MCPNCENRNEKFIVVHCKEFKRHRGALDPSHKVKEHVSKMALLCIECLQKARAEKAVEAAVKETRTIKFEEPEKAKEPTKQRREQAASAIIANKDVGKKVSRMAGGGGVGVGV